jgi:hypothetical protein
MHEFDFVTSVHGVVGELAVIVDSAPGGPSQLDADSAGWFVARLQESIEELARLAAMLGRQIGVEVSISITAQGDSQ